MSMPSYGVYQNMHLALGREFQIMATMRNPNTISVRDYGFVQTEAGPEPFYTMTYLPKALTLIEAGAQLLVAG
ncbi:MAG: hypothetical protein GY820_11375 [Gammaproteobacteria bacterium]|nr:hypothetical protein [Gammaproteobacteria bacterium]